MKLTIFLAFFVILTFSVVAAEQTVTLTVRIGNIPKGQGNLLIGLYDSAKSYTKTPMPQSTVVPLKSTKPVLAAISGVKPGTYAIVIVHDLNGNGKLDKNLFGMPKEPLAFSRDPKIPMGLPAFDACSFVVGTKDLSFEIPLKLE